MIDDHSHKLGERSTILKLFYAEDPLFTLDFSPSEWATNRNSVNSPSEGSITARPYPYLFVTDDTLFLSNEYSEDGRRLGINSCFKSPTSIWELQVGPSRASALQLQHPSDSEPSVLADPAAALFAISATNISDPSRPLFRFASAGDDDIIPTVDKILEKFMGGFAGLYAENLSRVSRLEVIITDLEEPESVVRLTRSRLPNPARTFGASLHWQPDGRKLALYSRATQTVLNKLALGKLEKSTQGNLTWIGKSSRCHRLLLALRMLCAISEPPCSPS
ncbi:hypothetical protein BGY98DRAFT_1189854 [Russula aff. rugulosa BPL654]|nr:hypothetical protein BGY98DRAFT_1189854 [Russula aff. rugulosa BPL654]